MKEVYRTVKVSDTTKPQSLSVFDQINLLMSRVGDKDIAELDAIEKMNSVKVQQMSSLTKFFEKAIHVMNEANYNSVTVEVPSTYLPYIDDVISEENGLGRFYKFDVYKKDIPINVKHTFIVRVFKKFG